MPRAGRAASLMGVMLAVHRARSNAALRRRRIHLSRRVSFGNSLLRFRASDKGALRRAWLLGDDGRHPLFGSDGDLGRVAGDCAGPASRDQPGGRFGRRILLVLRTVPDTRRLAGRSLGRTPRIDELCRGLVAGHGRAGIGARSRLACGDARAMRHRAGRRIRHHCQFLAPLDAVRTARLFS